MDMGSIWMVVADAGLKSATAAAEPSAQAPVGGKLAAKSQGLSVQLSVPERATVAAVGATGFADNELYGPRSIACDRWGNAYVADRGNGCVKIFNASGSYLSSFTPAGGAPC